MRTSILFTLVFSALFSSNVFSQYVTKSPNVALNSTVNLRTSGLRATKGNDIWGWTDPATNKEYAIMGLDSKTSFVDVTNPNRPVHVADIKTRTSNSTWRDIKIYKNYAYIVSEAWNHGMQIVDLTKLRGLTGNPVKILTSDKDYTGFGNAHNIAINEQTGYAYAVGTKTCDGGLHIMDIRSPLNPKFVNCVGRKVYEIPRRRSEFQPESIQHGNAYTHDVQCVVYRGPDKKYFGKEICVSSNEDSVNIVDVTNKAKPYQISALTYAGVKYTHQGWLTGDHSYFLLGDELDEQRLRVKTKTFIFDVRNLENPKFLSVYQHNTNAIDHNMYVKGNYVYQANYTAGMRILDLTYVSSGKLKEVGFLDTMPNSDKAEFKGVWSVFPYFRSGTVVVSGINGVLYTTTNTLR